MVPFQMLGTAFSSLSQTLFGSNAANAAANKVEQANHTCGEYNFSFNGLTIGQVASASSAAAGGGAVTVWVQSAMELARHEIASSFPGGMSAMTCNVLTSVLKQMVTMCNPDIVLNEFRKLIGCKIHGEKEKSVKTAERWSGFLKKMAIAMNVTNSAGQTHTGHMAIDAVRHHHTITHSRIC